MFGGSVGVVFCSWFFIFELEPLVVICFGLILTLTPDRVVFGRLMFYNCCCPDDSFLWITLPGLNCCTNSRVKKKGIETHFEGCEVANLILCLDW